MSQKSSSKIPVASPSERTPRSGEGPKSGEKVVSRSKFELIAELGRGGMATVYLARARRRPEKMIVLKQLRTDLAENEDFLAMFLEEARLAGQLRHPNIVETFEVGKDEDKYYIAMEYLDGLSLQAVLTKFGWKGQFSFPLQVFVLIEALRALEQAYTQRGDDGLELKIVHRDVSPPNIILTFDGHVKLVDFGIAKAANSTVETRTGLIKGKLTYMAPEQAASGDVDSRTDIYSIGVMLWQAAAGKRRWKGIENTEVLKRLHAGKVSDTPDAKSNGLPASVDAIVLRAISADPEERYASAAEFRAALEKLLHDLNAEVKTKDLGAFMATSFGDARKHAAEVMRLRINELNGHQMVHSRPDEPKRSETTSSRSPPPPATAEVSGTLISSGAPARLRGRRSHVVPIGFVGLTIAVVLAFWALEIHSGRQAMPVANPLGAGRGLPALKP